MMNPALKAPRPAASLPRSPRQTLDELVRLGFRPYACGDPGYGVAVIWARTEYKRVPGVFRNEQCGWKKDAPWVGTEGLLPDMEGTLQVVQELGQCTDVHLRPIHRSLEHLMGASLYVVKDDLDEYDLRNVDELLAP